MAQNRTLSPVLIRLVVALVVGVAAGLLVGWGLGVPSGLLSGWGVFALTEVVWVLLVVWRMDAAATRAHATAEDVGRPVARIIALLGSVTSLGAVALVLLQTHDLPRRDAFVLAAIAVLSVAASWALIQLNYMLRIAREYYADPVGGIDFNQHEDPMYTDFLYVSVGLGLAYQISDTSLRTNEMRRIVIGQTLLAYMFGAIILASVVNLVAGLA